MRYFIITILFILMISMGYFLSETEQNLTERATYSMGFVILGGYFIGKLSQKVGLPLITGYLFAGILCGPGILGFIQKDVRAYLKVIDDLALALIAFTAGGEMEIERLKGRLGSLSIIMITHVLIVFTGIFAFLMTFRRFFLTGFELPFAHQVAAILFLATIATASSPATAIAVIIETKAKGRFTDVVLTITMAKDIVVLILFTVVMGFSFSMAKPGEEMDLHMLLEPLWEIGASFVLGAVLAIGVIVFLKRLNQRSVIGILGISILLVELSSVTHLSLLLMCMVIGFIIKNYSDVGERFISGIEGGSVGIYIIFFTLAGASLNFGKLADLWLFSLVYCIVRGALMWSGTWLGAWWTDSGSRVSNWAWTGFIGQAGVSLGLLILIQRNLPLLKDILTPLIMSAIIINQIAGPILFKLALVKKTDDA